MLTAFYCHFTQPSCAAKKQINGSAEHPWDATFRDVCFLQAAQGNPLKADQVIGCLFFWFVFFGQAKKMNK
jgi:hypothetical protein